MKRIKDFRRTLAAHPLASHFPNGRIFPTANGRLRIEGEEDRMDVLMSEVSDAYYSGLLDPQRVDVVVAERLDGGAPALRNVVAN